MSNQTSGFGPPRTNGVGIQPPGDTGVPNQSSSFAKSVGIQIVREVDGFPSIEPVTILEVSNGTLTNPAAGVARISTGGGGGGTDPFFTEDFVPTLGQTVFVLSAAPGPGALVLLVINGHVYYPSTSFSIAGTTLTWLDVGFSLDPDDKVRVIYTTAPSFTSADFVPTLGQTIFVLPSLPASSVVLMVLNGALYYPPSSFTVVGTTVTWLNGATIPLDPDDKVRFYF